MTVAGQAAASAQCHTVVLIPGQNGLLFIFLKRQLGMRLELLVRLAFVSRHEIFSLELVLMLFSILALHNVRLMQSVQQMRIIRL